MWLFVTCKMSQLPSASSKNSHKHHSSRHASYHFPVSAGCVKIDNSAGQPHLQSLLSPPPVKPLNSSCFDSFTEAVGFPRPQANNNNCGGSTAGRKMTIGAKYEDISEGQVTPLPSHHPSTNYRSSGCSAIPSTSLSQDDVGLVDTDEDYRGGGGEDQHCLLLGFNNSRSGSISPAGSDPRSVSAANDPHSEHIVAGGTSIHNHHRSDPRTNDGAGDDSSYLRHKPGLAGPHGASNDANSATSSGDNTVENSHTSSSDGFSDLSSMSPTSTETPNSVSDQPHPHLPPVGRSVSGQVGSSGHHNGHLENDQMSSNPPTTSCGEPQLPRNHVRVNSLSTSLIDSLLVSPPPSPSRALPKTDVCSTMVGRNLENFSSIDPHIPFMAVIHPPTTNSDCSAAACDNYGVSSGGNVHIGPITPIAEFPDNNQPNRYSSPLAIDDAAEALLFLASQSTLPPRSEFSTNGGNFPNSSFISTPYTAGGGGLQQPSSIASTPQAGNTPFAHSTFISGYPPRVSPTGSQPIVPASDDSTLSHLHRHFISGNLSENNNWSTPTIQTQPPFATTSLFPSYPANSFIMPPSDNNSKNDNFLSAFPSGSCGDPVPPCTPIVGDGTLPADPAATFSLVSDDVMDDDEGFPPSTSSLVGGTADLRREGATSSLVDEGGATPPRVDSSSPEHVPLLSSSGGDFGSLLSDVHDLQAFAWNDGDLPPVVPVAGIQPPSSSLPSTLPSKLPPISLTATDQLPSSMVPQLDSGVAGSGGSLFPSSPRKSSLIGGSPVKPMPSSSIEGSDSATEPAAKRIRSDLWRGFTAEHSGHSSSSSHSKGSSNGRLAAPTALKLAPSSTSGGLSSGRNWVTIGGRRLTVVTPAAANSGDHRVPTVSKVPTVPSGSFSSRNPLVSLSEVYRTFYAANWLWDEFKREVVCRFAIRPTKCRLVNGLGRTEMVDAVSTGQITDLLSKLKPTDRPVAPKLSDKERPKDSRHSQLPKSASAPRMANGDHPFGMELGRGDAIASATVATKMDGKWGKKSCPPDSSAASATSPNSIKTRTTTQKDIFLVDYLGRTLPAILFDGTEWTRLVDIEQTIFQQSKSNSAVGGQVDHMKKTCVRLGLPVTKCKANEKARLVVYANSVRHGSLHVVKVKDLPTLLTAERKRRGVKDGRISANASPAKQRPTESAFATGDVGKSNRWTPKTDGNRRLSASSDGEISDSDSDSGSGKNDGGGGRENHKNDASSSDSDSEISDSDLPPVAMDLLPTAGADSAKCSIEPDFKKYKNNSPRLTPGRDDAKLAKMNNRTSASKNRRRSANSVSSSSDWSDSVTDSSANEADEVIETNFRPPKKSLVKNSHSPNQLTTRSPAAKSTPNSSRESFNSKESKSNSGSRKLPASAVHGYTNSSARDKSSKRASDLIDYLESTASESSSRRRLKNSDHHRKSSLGTALPSRPVFVKPDFLVHVSEDVSLGQLVEVGVSGGRGKSVGSPPRPSVSGLRTGTASLWTMPNILVGTSVPLPLIVCNNRGQRGPVGKYYNCLFRTRLSDCILCCSCRQFWPIRDFLVHTHSVEGVPIGDPKLLMYVNNPTEARFDLWSRFVSKLRRFRYKRQVYDLPTDLAEFHDRLSAAQTFQQTTMAIEARQAADSRQGTGLNGPVTINNSEIPAPVSSDPSSLPGPLIPEGLQGSGKPENVQNSNNDNSDGRTRFQKPPTVLSLKLPKRKKPRGDAGQFVAHRVAADREGHVDRYRTMADGMIGLSDTAKESVIDQWFR